MMPPAAAPVQSLAEVIARVDEVLEDFLARQRSEALAIEPRAGEPVEEIARLVRAGGKRIRPAFCYWGYRAAGGLDGDAIFRAAAALELLHTMALIHDDVMDADEVRRGVPTTQARQVAAAKERGQRAPDLVGTGVAIVAGDLAAALSDQLFQTAGFPPERMAVGSARLHRMRLELAAGAYLDLADRREDADLVAYLKGGAYTVEGPLLIGSALAAEAPDVDELLRGYARPLGRAFQLLDDLRDGDAQPGASRADAEALVSAARKALTDAPLPADAARALRQLADLVGSL